MAYLAFDDSGLAPVAHRLPADPAPTPTARLSALEWAVVALARRDTTASLRRPGRLAVAWRTLLRGHNPRLADERLEALRRIAVLSWRHGYTVPSHEVAAFLAAGFTADQYETMLTSIGVAQARERRR